MGTLSKAGRDFIRRMEGCRLHRYPDSAGIWTIGVGAIHDLKGDRVTALTPDLTAAQADALLQRDTARAAGAVTRLIAVPLTQQQFDALCSFAFNVGTGALQSSTLRQAINRGEDPGEDLFARWDLAGGRHQPGLRHRRLAEYQLFESIAPKAEKAEAA